MNGDVDVFTVNLILHTMYQSCLSDTRSFVKVYKLKVTLKNSS